MNITMTVLQLYHRTVITIYNIKYLIVCFPIAYRSFFQFDLFVIFSILLAWFFTWIPFDFTPIPFNGLISLLLLYTFILLFLFVEHLFCCSFSLLSVLLILFFIDFYYFLLFQNNHTNWGLNCHPRTVIVCLKIVHKTTKRSAKFAVPIGRDFTTETLLVNFAFVIMVKCQKDIKSELLYHRSVKPKELSI